MTGSPSAPRKGAIVVTQDIPLAARAVKAGAVALAPNGKPFSESSIGMTLATRNLMDQLRSAGEITGGPKPFSPKDRSAFLGSLDREIVRLKRARLRLESCRQSFRLAGTLPPPSASLAMTCLCSQIFISAEPSSAPL